jgi:hypothetical protein
MGRKLPHVPRQRRPKRTAPTTPRACLRCDRSFPSEGPHHRLCDGCRNFLALESTPVERARVLTPRHRASAD